MGEIDQNEGHDPKPGAKQSWLYSCAQKCKESCINYYQKSKNALGHVWGHRQDTNQSLAFATWALAAFALGALWDSRDALEHGQRAWLSPQNAIVETASPLGKGAPLRFEIIYSNSGREPALGFSSDVEAITAPLPPKWTSGEWTDLVVGDNDTCASLNPIDGGPVIYPELSAFSPTMSLYATVNDSARIAQIAVPEVVLVLRGCLVYKTYDKRRESAFCFFLAPVLNTPPDKWTFRQCFRGNHAT
jgi:hypothetical protein